MSKTFGIFSADKTLYSHTNYTPALDMSKAQKHNIFSLPTFAMCVSLACYIFLAFLNLTHYPLYFFCDEAVHGVEAYNLLSTGKDSGGTFLPLFVRAFGEYQFGLSVYLQIPFILIFGVTEEAVRMRSAVCSLIGVAGMVLIARHLGARTIRFVIPALLGLTPFWLIHARTGWEVLTAVSFILIGLSQYLDAFFNSEQTSKLKVWVAGLCFAAAFYTYAPARGWVLLLIPLLLLVNCATHLREWRRSLSLILASLCALLPYLVFHLNNPDAALQRLRMLGVGQISDLFTHDRLHLAATNVVMILNPYFWFIREGSWVGEFNERHVIPGIAEIAIWLLPFWIIGVVVQLCSLRSAQVRATWCLPLAGLFPAVFININPLRCMLIGVFNLLCVFQGIGWCFSFIKTPVVRSLSVVLLSAVLVLLSIGMRRHILTQAPYSHRDYGFYGIQMGAPELYRWIGENQGNHSKIVISNALFNANEIFPRFYFPDNEKLREKIEIYDFANCQPAPPIRDNTVWVIPLWIWEEAQDSECFTGMHTIGRISDPLQRTLFLILKAKTPQP